MPGAPLEIRCAWGPTHDYCFTSTALTSQIWLIYENGDAWEASGDPQTSMAQGDPIYTNFHYCGDVDWESGQRRRLVDGNRLVLVTDRGKLRIWEQRALAEVFRVQAPGYATQFLRVAPKLDADTDLDGPTLDNSKEGFDVHNVSARWAPEMVEGLALTVGVDNVFDEYYASQSSRTGVSFHPRFGELLRAHDLDALGVGMLENPVDAGDCVRSHAAPAVVKHLDGVNRGAARDTLIGTAGHTAIAANDACDMGAMPVAIEKIAGINVDRDVVDVQVSLGVGIGDPKPYLGRR